MAPTAIEKGVAGCIPVLSIADADEFRAFRIGLGNNLPILKCSHPERSEGSQRSDLVSGDEILRRSASQNDILGKLFNRGSLSVTEAIPETSFPCEV